MAPLIDVYNTKTGRKQRIPERWLGHKTLGKNFEKTPRQKARDEATEQVEVREPAEAPKPKTARKPAGNK